MRLVIVFNRKGRAAETYQFTSFVEFYKWLLQKVPPKLVSRRLFYTFKNGRWGPSHTGRPSRDFEIHSDVTDYRAAHDLGRSTGFVRFRWGQPWTFREDRALVFATAVDKWAQNHGHRTVQQTEASKKAGTQESSEVEATGLKGPDIAGASVYRKHQYHSIMRMGGSRVLALGRHLLPEWKMVRVTEIGRGNGWVEVRIEHVE